MLHMISPGRYDDVAAIVGDVEALLKLRNALDDAILTGTGGTFLFQSDGEGYSFAIVRVEDMYPVHTTYAGEINPVRSGRETVSLRGVPNFLQALCKAALLSALPIPRFLEPKQST
ncbi:hypothetical protein CR103_15710 [Massilia psychrophila]|uniref:Uncharacterized protein n=2 Tax=Massilia psychrophila TaxID=1603353 RepID=A0A2G8SYP8_9BURK|nr:hypothetical protein CR103_15710 [Massilia psychrophila]